MTLVNFNINSLPYTSTKEVYGSIIAKRNVKKVVLIFLLLKNLFFYSQTYEVRDYLTKEHLPFATIIFDDIEGIYTNENGVFQLNSKYKSIRISYVGYEDYTAKVEMLKDTVFLKPITYNIEEITITNSKNPLEKIGFLKSKGIKNIKSTPLSPKSEQIIVLTPINTDIIDSYIEKVEFPLNKVKHYNKTDKLYKNAPAVVRINIYTSENNLPKEKIFSSKPIKFIMSDKEVVSVDVSEEMIQLNEKGLCFGIEMIGRINENGEFVEENSYARPLLTNQTSKDYKAVTYMTNSILKKESEYYPVNDINQHLMRDIKNYKYQDYNLAIGLTIRKQ